MMIWEKYYKSLTERICISAVVDIGGSKGGGRETLPLRGSNSFNFMQCLGKFGKIVCWRPPSFGGSVPHLGEILDLPLVEKKQG